MRAIPAVATAEPAAISVADPIPPLRPLPRVVLVEDEPDAREALARIVTAEGFVVALAATLAEAKRLLHVDPPHLVVADLRLPDGNGLDLVRALRDTPAVEVVVVTGHATIETAIEALRLGAFDYVTKPVDVAHLKRVLANIRRTIQLRGEIGVLRAELRSLGRFGRLVGVSAAMQKVYDTLGRVGPTDASVLLAGESGTGKELAAMTLHDLSRRRDQPFLAINCGAIPSTMIESEIFGHERGSFTGALQRHAGYFERAAGGTLFLDEISEMPADLQVRLLRVLESGTLMRVGGEKPVPVDVRLIAATNRVPEEAVAAGKLRDDLFYRLAVVRVLMPPLRERGDDIRLLSEHFLQIANGDSASPKRLTSATIKALAGYAWPGNVRELKNVIQSASIMADAEIEPRHLPFSPVEATLRLTAETGDNVDSAVRPTTPEALREEEPSAAGLQIPLGTTAAEAERRLILATLKHCGGKKKEAARILSLSLKTMYNRLRSYAGPRATGTAHSAKAE